MPVENERQQSREDRRREQKLARLRREYQFQVVALLVCYSALAWWTGTIEVWRGVGHLVTMVILQVIAYIVFVRRRRKLAE